MKNIRQITKDLYYIGVNDRRINLFENVYPISDGVSYNSYFLDGEKTVLFDTVDKSQSEQFFENLDSILNSRNLDYFIINHLEPDHSALIKDVVEKYPLVKIICNAKIKQMLYQFFEFKNDIESNFQIIKEGDIVEINNHKFTFVMAPMVHWPEVMVTYDMTDKILFSADAFGSFGALDGNIFDDEVDIEQKINEYRRYYTNIVGKYGVQVMNLLNKASKLEINMVCPLHGYILKKNIGMLVDKYTHWASYKPEIKSVLLLYGSIYGATQNATEILASKLANFGIKNIKMFDVSRVHSSFIVSESFKYSHIVVASATYNNEIFVNMDNCLSDIVKHNLQNRTFAIIENGSWAPNVKQAIKSKLENLKGSKFIEKEITIKSSLKNCQEEELTQLAQLIYDDINQ